MSPGHIDVDRTRLAGHRLLQREVDLLRDALQVVHAIDLLAAAAHQFDLVDLLEHLAAELADRARAAERHHRAAVDQRVGHAGDQVGHAGAGRRHADARRLPQPAIGLARERRRLLVADVDHADAFRDAGGLGQQHRAAHDVEDVLDAFLLQALRQDFRAGQFRHLCPSPRHPAKRVSSPGPHAWEQPNRSRRCSSGRRSHRLSRPSQSLSTCSLFCPSSGDGFTGGGLPSKRTGQAGMRERPDRRMLDRLA